MNVCSFVSNGDILFTAFRIHNCDEMSSTFYEELEHTSDSGFQWKVGGKSVFAASRVYMKVTILTIMFNKVTSESPTARNTAAQHCDLSKHFSGNACIRKVRGSNFGRNTDNPHWGFRGFSQTLQGKARIVTTPQPLPSTSFPNHLLSSNYTN
jgi:hypothetical protein